MKFAFVNPNWDFRQSTYFGCRESHYPLELRCARRGMTVCWWTRSY